MTTRTRTAALETKLAAMLAESFPGLTVEVGHSKRWKRMCVTFRWDGFAGLLPEERFFRLTRVIPEGFREAHLKGFVWLELAPDETVDAFLALPRSEDAADREPELYAALLRIGFFDSLREAMGSSPGEQCRGDFSQADAVLAAAQSSPAESRGAKLVFIRHGVYCDCQILETVQPALAEAYGDTV
jgi:hypothetical protein